MKPLVLCILDGVGIRESTHGNAVKSAKMPNIDKLKNEYSWSLLNASEEPVGLPKGQMGNSEVGHTNIGAGRVVYQPLELINKSIVTRELYSNSKILEIINYTKQNKSRLHIMGLLSDGGIHSHINHLFALLDICKKENVDQVYLHVFLDGRDTLPTEGLKYLNQLNDKIKEINLGVICTVSGRYYSMDRDNNYDRLKKSYDAIVYGKGKKYKSYEDGIKYNLKKGITDEFTVPFILADGKIKDKDGVIFFNYRPDRLREMGIVLTDNSFNQFKVKKFKKLKLITMMPISEEVKSESIFPHFELKNTFGEYISNYGLTQLRIAETEKYAHVTYFFDGGIDKELVGSKRVLIPSPKVATYDLQPEMSAREITTSLLNEINNFDVVILNFANGDMVGHTGNFDATVKALETVDECVGEIYDRLQEINGTMIVTADHGNSDWMLDDQDNPVTSHSLSKVPFLITDKKYKVKDGKLADIAPTMLNILGLPVPEEMTGETLIVLDSVDEVKKDVIPKKKNKLFDIIFIVLSSVLILSMIGVYGVRFIYYYNKSHSVPVYHEVSIVDKLGAMNFYQDQPGIYDDGKIKYFKGNVDNNYLYFNGLLWRIVSYTSDSVKLITDESVTTLYAGDNDVNYISKWLDDYKSKLFDKNYMIDSFSLLSSEEYNNSIMDGTYLNDHTYWFTSDNKFINPKGEVNDNIDGKYGVRLVVSLKTDSIIISGDGTLKSSFKIVNENPNNVKDAHIGNYIKYGDYVWRISDINDSKVKLLLNETVGDVFYSLDNKMIDSNIKYSAGYYLNHDFYDSVRKDKLVLNKWNVINYSDYDYSKIEKSYEAYVGLSNIGELFINDFDGYYLNTISHNNTVYSVKQFNRVYMGLRSSESSLRPSIVISDASIIGGTGSLIDPYVVGE